MNSLHLLGTLRLEGPGGPFTDRSVERRQLALLSALGVAGARGISRDRLLGFLWPEVPEGRARRALSDSLYLLRQSLGEDSIVESGRVLRLNVRLVETDVHLFETALARKDLSAAVEAYSGHLLDGFHAGGGAEFDQWIDSERQRLIDEYGAAVESLAQDAHSRGEYNQAADLWRRAVRHDPYCTRYVFELMKALEAAGDSANAAQVAISHEELLRNDLDVGLPEEVTTYLARLRRREQKISKGPGSEQGTSGPEHKVVNVHPPRDPSRHESVPVQLGLIVAVSAIVSLGAFFVVREWSHESDRSSLSLPRRVAVAPFMDLAGDSSDAWLGIAIADYVAASISASRAASPVSTLDVLSAYQHVMSTADSDYGTPDWIRLFANETKSEFVVLGTYYRSLDSLYVGGEIREIEGGETFASIGPMALPGDDPIASLSSLAERLATGLAIRLDPEVDKLVKYASQPVRFDAYREWYEGLSLFTQPGKMGIAIEHFHRAAEKDSTFLTPLIFATIGHMNFGDFALADSIVNGLAPRRATMSPIDRHLFDHQFWEIRGDWEEALRASRQVTELAPGSAFQFEVGRDALYAKRPREAIAVLADMDPSVGVMRRWPFYWWILTRAYHAVGEHEEELRAARRAQALQPDIDWHVEFEVRALAVLGRREEVEAVIGGNVARLRFAGYLMRTAGVEFRAHGFDTVGEDFLRRSSEWFEQYDLDEYWWVREEAGRSLYQEGRWQDAREVIRPLHTARPHRSIYLGYLGSIAGQIGDTVEAARIDRILSKWDRRYEFGEIAYWRAVIAIAIGDTVRGVSLLGAAYNRGHPYFDRSRYDRELPHTDIGLASIQGYSPYRKLVASDN